MKIPGIIAAAKKRGRIDEPLLVALLFISAGVLVYVGATHLLRRAEKENEGFGLPVFGTGIAAAPGDFF
jgi:hypothetical protein